MSSSTPAAPPFDSPCPSPSANRKVRSWRATSRENALSERSESKGPLQRSCSPLTDDVIVVFVWFVYILQCKDDSLYIGETGNLKSRLVKHNDGSASSFTALRRPVRLVFSETHPNREAALKREQQLKRWTRAKKEALITGTIALLKRL